MAEHAQIDVRKGNKVVRIHAGWGIPRNVFAALRECLNAGCKTPSSVAKKFIASLKDSSFGLSIIAKNFQRDALSFYYTVDISKSPWVVVREKSAHYKVIERGDGTGYVDRNLTPARKRTFLIGE